VYKLQVTVERPTFGSIRAVAAKSFVRSTLFVVLLLALPCVLAAKARGAAGTRYISPTGRDSNPGTQDRPWKTFDFAITKLNPGNTLVLEDGIYDSSTSGFPSIDCSGGPKTGAKNGSAAAPITFQAEHERQAFLQGDGSQGPFVMRNCSYWRIAGLHVENHADTPSAKTNVHNMAFENCDHLSIRRNLVAYVNRYHNDHAILLSHVTDSLIEENEIYFFNRHAVLLAYGNGPNLGHNIVRRNYANSRGYADCTLPGCRPSDDPNQGDAAFIAYPNGDDIFENNISENNQRGLEIEAAWVPNGSINNQWLGDISIHDSYGARFAARCEEGQSAACMPQNSRLENFVAVNSAARGLYSRSAKATSCTNCTIVAGPQSASEFVGIDADEAGVDLGDGNYSIFLTNTSLVGGRQGTAVSLNVRSGSWTWKVNHVNIYNFHNNFAPTLTGTDLVASYRNPGMGACYLWLPDNSSLKRAGVSGADIGANILFRYENGTLTNTPLWSKDGDFPHGAIVRGLNDIPGTSLIDLKDRLNVNRNGCSFPSGYQGW
jgi:Protein of unknown function (DUF1565)